MFLGMAFTVNADVFIPAGGRPFTINDGNWRNFLQADGTPSSRLIVEGANIFVRIVQKALTASGQCRGEKEIV